MPLKKYISFSIITDLQVTMILNISDDKDTYLMSKEHIIYYVLINDRGLIHQSVYFPPGSTFLNPLEQEDEAIDGAEETNYSSYFRFVVATYI